MSAIVPTRGRNNREQATCTCEECRASVTIMASHKRKEGRLPGGEYRMELCSEGRALAKLNGMGWRTIKGKLRCPACAAKAKGEIIQEINMKPAEQPKTNVTEIRQPTPAQKRDIIRLLETAYDDDAKRYRGADTDVTIADMIGGGCMWGWVAQIREELFGPAGGNEELEKLTEDVQRLLALCELGKEQSRNLAGAAIEMQDAYKKDHAALVEIKTRLEAINKALGPKAVRA